MSVMIILICSLLIGCQQSQVTDVEIRAQIQKQRLEKDASFKNDYDSPLPEEDKKSFAGLDYFPIDLGYRYEVKLHKYDDPVKFKIIASSGKQRDALKYGYFAFTMDAHKCTLQVYELLDIRDAYPGYLFVPFMDTTTGQETYPGGRYLDFQEHDSDGYVLDFNLAYNPSCAYGRPGYNCPIPPKENRLAVAIKAGEKDYALRKH